MIRRKYKKRKHGFAVLIMFCVILTGAAGAQRVVNWNKGTDQGKSSIPYQKTSGEMENATDKYYYEQLADEEKQIYQEILEGVRNHTEEIYVHASDANQANQIFQDIIKDQPDVFWCDGTATAVSHKGNESYTVLKPKYIYDAGESTSMSQEIEQQVDEWLKDLENDTDDYHKILYVYEKIVDMVDYDAEASDNQNIYSVFVNHRSVCAGYSRATQYLLEKLGVFCTYVTGKTTGGESHAWNLVKCNGDYYYVDTTWGDPVFQKAEGEETSADQNISYDYMCCDDTELLQTHVPDSGTVLPACSKMDANYYVVNGMYYQQYDGEQVLNAMNQSVWNKESSTTFKFADEDLYQQAHDDIFQNQLQKAAKNLAQAYGLAQVKYQYIDDPRLHKIVIFWQYS